MKVRFRVGGGRTGYWGTMIDRVSRPGVGPDQARIAAMLLLTLRGTPTIYYGDEIGLENVPIEPSQVPRSVREKRPGFGTGT